MLRRVSPKFTFLAREICLICNQIYLVTKIPETDQRGNEDG